MSAANCSKTQGVFVFALRFLSTQLNQHAETKIYQTGIGSRDTTRNTHAHTHTHTHTHTHAPQKAQTKAANTKRSKRRKGATQAHKAKHTRLSDTLFQTTDYATNEKQNRNVGKTCGTNFRLESTHILSTTFAKHPGNLRPNRSRRRFPATNCTQRLDPTQNVASSPICSLDFGVRNTACSANLSRRMSQGSWGAMSNESEERRRPLSQHCSMNNSKHGYVSSGVKRCKIESHQSSDGVNPNASQKRRQATI